MAGPCRSNLYIYGDSGPVKAIVEWPSYGMDDRYLAGIWQADLLYGLCWFCLTPGERAFVTERHPGHGPRLTTLRFVTIEKSIQTILEVKVTPGATIGM